MSGLGELTVENGTALDAVVRLVRLSSDQTTRWFYVRAKQSVPIAGIPAGEYRLLYTSGADWDDSATQFRLSANYDEFERMLSYHETPEESGKTIYKSFSVTLQPVLYGNVRTRKISRDEFLRGHRSRALSQR